MSSSTDSRKDYAPKAAISNVLDHFEPILQGTGIGGHDGHGRIKAGRASVNVLLSLCICFGNAMVTKSCCVKSSLSEKRLELVTTLPETVTVIAVSDFLSNVPFQ